MAKLSVEFKKCFLLFATSISSIHCDIVLSMKRKSFFSTGITLLEMLIIFA